MEIPHTVHKLELSETGTVDHGAGSLDNFSLSQVVFLRKRND
jgi:hypothetical protein